MERPPKPQGDEGPLPGQQGLELLHPRLPLVVLCRPLDGGDGLGVGRQLRHVEQVVVGGKAALGEPQGQGAGGVAGDGHVVLAVRHASEQGGRVHRLDGDSDARLRQLLLHQGGQAGAVGGAGQGCMCAENSSFLKEGYQHLLLECIRRFGKETPEPEKEEQSPVSWLMPEKEKKSPVSWLVPEKETELIESFQPVWKRAARKLAENYGAGGLRRGQNRGGKKETLSGIEKRAYDYRRFLKRFTVTREEMELDLDSFDPVAYHYGLMYYGNFPFIEPPETREGNRLEELVIAIDTSGSCKKEIVAKFLGETRSILEEKENFFSRWNVCLIQCDSFVQDVTMIHSPKEWEAYRETITIKGRGGTDFRPVFQKVEELRKQHVFRNLKALIYFTDGDGIYPEQKPDYETAFVFVRQTEKMNLVPKWAKKLLTEECTL